MLSFIIGLIVGGIIGLVICAICSMSGTNERIGTQPKQGDSDAHND